MALLSTRDYAKHRNVSSRAVELALKSGRIHRDPVNGLIDSAVADREWLANTDPKAQKGGIRTGELRKIRKEQGIQSREVEPLPTASTSDIDGYSKARAVRERYAAMILKSQYEERAGKLVSADDVRTAAYTRNRVLRDLLMGIPDRISAELAVEESAANCHRLLEKEIRACLDKVAGMTEVAGVARRGMKYGNVG